MHFDSLWHLSCENLFPHVESNDDLLQQIPLNENVTMVITKFIFSIETTLA